MKSHKIKKKLYLEKIKLKTHEANNKYKKHSNKLSHIKEAAKKLYFKKLFMKSQNNSKKTWKHINDITKYRKPITNSIDCIRDNDNCLQYDDHKISNIMNNYFVEIGTKIGNSCKSVTTPFSKTPTVSPMDSFVLSPVLPEEITKIIKNLNINKSTGPNDPPIRFIKLGCNILSEILAELINSSFRLGIFPSILKCATVIPIYKAGDKHLPNNHRPISLLSPLSKIIERCIHKQLMSFFNKYQIIHANQFGFQNKMSTEMAISKVHQELSEKLDNNNITCSIFLDIRKAFDSINHKILVKKLRDCGVRGIPLKLIKCFLTNRTQSVFLNGVTSNPQTIQCGVPQGSVLGPLLFLTYINDLPRASKFKTYLFADDACLSMSSTSMTDLQVQANQELDKISDWMSRNKLCLNYEKTVFFTLTKRKLSTKLTLMIDNNLIKEVAKTKYLGVIVDNKLSWEHHISSASNKMAKGSWAISCVKKYVDLQTLKMLYFSLIYPHLHYGITSWGATSKSHLKKLEIRQKQALKIMTGSAFDSPSAPLFLQLGFLKLNDIYRHKVGIEMRRMLAFNQLTDNSIQTIQSTHSYQTRSNTQHNLFVPRVRTNVGKSSLRYQGPVVWNEVPNNLKTKSINGFKFHFKKYLLSKYNI